VRTFVNATLFPCPANNKGKIKIKIQKKLAKHQK
jgi:hypothetical protein